MSTEHPNPDDPTGVVPEAGDTAEQAAQTADTAEAETTGEGPPPPSEPPRGPGGAGPGRLPTWLRVLAGAAIAVAVLLLVALVARVRDLDDRIDVLEDEAAEREQPLDRGPPFRDRDDRRGPSQRDDVPPGFEERAHELEELEEHLEERARELEEERREFEERREEFEQRERDRSEGDESFGDGVHEVGEDVEPGSYVSDGSEACYWAKLDSDDTDDIIANHLGIGPQEVVVDSPFFESRECGDWVRVG